MAALLTADEVPWFKLFRSREILAFPARNTFEARIVAGNILHSYPFAREMSMFELAFHGGLRCKHHEALATCPKCGPGLDDFTSPVWQEEPL